MSDLICEECGSTGERGELGYADGTRKHFRDKSAWNDGKIHAVLCSGKFVPRKRREINLRAFQTQRAGLKSEFPGDGQK